MTDERGTVQKNLPAAVQGENKTQKKKKTRVLESFAYNLFLSTKLQKRAIACELTTE